ncbi:agmatinase [Thermoplasmatales archaeon ex4572_165]|nr:MAG: agmatinase [Thermoplasmatales archaeon ex4572_165]RLF59565.1 MAG: agmatinase [Thermoplasmata archaeon]
MMKKQPQFPNYFADAESDYSKAKYVIFGVPYDKTSSFRYGSKEGPDSIRHASWNFESFDLLTKIDFSKLPVHDYGNIDGISQLKPKDMIKKVNDFSKMVLQDSKIPIGIGGEHSVTSGIIKSIPSDTFVVIFDAHLDYRQSYEQDIYNHACTIKRISDIIPHENIVILGVRSAEKNEYENAKKDNVSFIESSKIIKEGMLSTIKDIKKQIGQQQIYLSIDIDVIDPAYAPGTGTPEPFGLNPYEICIAFDILKDNLIGFDVMEVNPLFDHGQSSMLAAKYIRYGIEIMK